MMMGDVSSHPLGAIVISNVSEVFSSVHLCEIQCSLARCMGSLPCFEGHCFGPFLLGARGDGLQRHFTMSTQTPGARQFSDHHEPKARISTFSVPNFYVGWPEFWSRIFRPNFFHEFFVGFPAAAAISRPEKKNQGENQGTCASARVGWCESLPRLVAEAPQIPRIAEWRTLAAVGLRAR